MNCFMMSNKFFTLFCLDRLMDIYVEKTEAYCLCVSACVIWFSEVPVSVRTLNNDVASSRVSKWNSGNAFSSSSHENFCEESPISNKIISLAHGLYYAPETRALVWKACNTSIFNSSAGFTYHNWRAWSFRSGKEIHKLSRWVIASSWVTWLLIPLGGRQVTSWHCCRIFILDLLILKFVGFNLLYFDNLHHATHNWVNATYFDPTWW